MFNIGKYNEVRTLCFHHRNLIIVYLKLFFKTTGHDDFSEKINKGKKAPISLAIGDD